MYRVDWSPAAREDLFAKVSSDEVAAELVAVSRNSFDLPPSADGGPLDGGGWRRGVSPARRVWLDAVEGRGEDLDAPGEHAWDYVLVYDQLGTASKPHYRVRAVLTNAEVGAGIGHLPALDAVPAFD
ncbi:hypothetical protein [Saccharothrix xinjiangensis]|uniref:Type II toxin-antitoxin system RelE/ParE family toxin n=1 Tax=Saccharothrix xinjiangensis TaxID=204798 RepID=A0ABV9XYS3_9PSEU